MHREVMLNPREHHPDRCCDRQEGREQPEMVGALQDRDSKQYEVRCIIPVRKERQQKRKSKQANARKDRF